MYRPFVVATLFAMLASSPLVADPPRQTSTRPVVGLRSADSSPVVLVGGEVVSAPGQPATRADVLIEGTSIKAVGENLDLPAGVERVDVSGRRIYAGLIDAMHEVGLPSELPKDRSDYWNANVTPGDRAVWADAPDDATLKKIRSQGITARVIAPDSGIIKGKSAVVLSLDEKSPQRVLVDDLWLHATLTVPRGKSRDRYPNSPMGATALVRQALYDAQWYGEANRTFQSNGSLSRPEPSDSLQLLAEAMESGSVVFDAANERMAVRSGDVGKEFSLQMILRGSGREYRDVDAIAHGGSPVLVPVDFPDSPNTSTAEAMRQTPLVEWMHWYFAPENPARLDQAGVRFCLTTDSLDDVGTFLKQIRVAIDRGLKPEVAHAAVTTTPADLIGISDQVGTVAAGKLANLMITDGELFDKKTKVIETWVAGARFLIAETGDVDSPLEGSWDLKVPTKAKSPRIRLDLKPKEKSGFEGELRLVAKVSSDEEDSEAKPKVAKLREVQFTGQQLSASVDLGDLGDEFPVGLTTLTLLVVEKSEKQEATVFADLIMPDGESRSVSLRRVDEKNKVEKETPEKSKAIQSESEAGQQDESEEEGVPNGMQELVVNFPLGAYGVAQEVSPQKTVLFRGATVWTCGESGILDDCDVLVCDGEITAVGQRLEVPKGCSVVNAKGKHITPGLIDCHSHMGTDGGVNESGQEVTAEVRIGDFIDDSDISIYRQLAGGVTTANILHGSANPIGGQSQAIKLRWGQSMAEMKFAGAPAGIKFALGEKRQTQRRTLPEHSDGRGANSA